MKQKLRKLFLCLALMLSVLMVTACGKKASKPLFTAEEEIQLKEGAKFVSTNLVDQIIRMSPDDRDEMIGLFEREKLPIMFNALTNFQNEKRLGEYEGIDENSMDALINGDTITVTFKANFEERPMDITLSWNAYNQNKIYNGDFSCMKEFSLVPEFTTAEQMKDAAGNLVVGMLTVFCVLVFISWIISLFKYIPVFEKKLKERKDAKTKAKAPVVKEEAPVVKEEVLVSDDISDDVIQAVIAAAIAAYESDNENDGFVPGETLNNGLMVRSIRRHRD